MLYIRQATPTTNQPARPKPDENPCRVLMSALPAASYPAHPARNHRQSKCADGLPVRTSGSEPLGVNFPVAPVRLAVLPFCCTKPWTPTSAARLSSPT